MNCQKLVSEMTLSLCCYSCSLIQTRVDMNRYRKDVENKSFVKYSCKMLIRPEFFIFRFTDPPDPIF